MNRDIINNSYAVFKKHFTYAEPSKWSSIKVTVGGEFDSRASNSVETFIELEFSGDDESSANSMTVSGDDESSANSMTVELDDNENCGVHCVRINVSGSWERSMLVKAMKYAAEVLEFMDGRGDDKAVAE